MVIKQVNLSVGDRAANWNSRRFFHDFLHRVPRGKRSGLSGTINVEQSPWRSMLQDFFNPSRIHSFASEQQVAHIPEGGWQFTDQMIEQGRSQEQHADLPPLDF